MGFREYLKKIEKQKKLQKISKPVSKHLEASGVLKAFEPRPVFFEKIKESSFSVAGNIFPTKDSISEYFGCKTNELIPRISNAIANMKTPEETKKPACQQVIEESVDLDSLPILFHCERDGGNYISSGIVVAKDKEWGQNLDFHRMMQIGKNKLAVRIVKDRHFDQYLKKNGEMDIAVCIGNGANTLVAAATSIELGKDEIGIANALEPLQVARAKTVDLLIPADCEFVLEGRIVLEEKSAEGPFVDLTETLDVVRQEPVFTVKKITHRKDAIWQALLPGALEHKILMGMPREPTMFKKINDAGIHCLDVNVNPGGCSWLHAIVKIDKQQEDDGKKAIAAAFEGHKSCKHIFIVDKDIDIYDPMNVEWAMATRFQADKDFIIKPREKGSSLDPSAEPDTHFTTKCGLDCTAPLESKGKSFSKEPFPKVDIQKYLGGKK